MAKSMPATKLAWPLYFHSVGHVAAFDKEVRFRLTVRLICEDARIQL